MYILRVCNRYNYGHSTFKCSSLDEVKKTINERLFDATDIHLYEAKEIPLPCDYETADRRELTELQKKSLWDDACVLKNKNQ